MEGRTPVWRRRRAPRRGAMRGGVPSSTPSPPPPTAPPPCLRRALCGGRVRRRRREEPRRPKGVGHDVIGRGHEDAKGGREEYTRINRAAAAAAAAAIGIGLSLAVAAGGGGAVDGRGDGGARKVPRVGGEGVLQTDARGRAPVGEREGVQCVAVKGADARALPPALGRVAPARRHAQPGDVVVVLVVALVVERAAVDPYREADHRRAEARRCAAAAGVGGRRRRRRGRRRRGRRGEGDVQQAQRGAWHLLGRGRGGAPCGGRRRRA